MKNSEILVKEDFENLTKKILDINTSIQEINVKISNNVKDEFTPRFNEILEKLSNVEIKLNQIIG